MSVTARCSRLLTIDAMGRQTEIAELIRGGEGDDVLAVKQNRPAPYDQVGEAIGIGLDDLPRPVGRAVLADHQLEREIGVLDQDALDRLGDPGCVTVGAQNDADEGLGR